MINELKPIAIFVEVVRSGSFRGAARQLNLSPSAVSYNVAQLEERVGNVLIYRTTRKLSLTKEGEHLYERSAELLANISLGLDEITGSYTSLRGRLTISATTALLHSNLNSSITRFCEKHPNIDVELYYTDERKDLVRDGIDVALRAGEMPDSTLRSKLITRIKRKLVCSKGYYNAQSTASHPSDLKSWQWIALSMMPEQRTLRLGRKVFKTQDVRSQISVNSVDAMLQFCCQGMGLSTPPQFLIETLLKRGSLIEVLPEWQVDDIPVYAVWPGSQVKNKHAYEFIEEIQGL